MRKLLPLIAILLVCAPAGFAQTDYSHWEFFIGYAHERANNGADRLDVRGRAINPNGSTQRVDLVSERIPYNGVSTELVANVTPHVGLVTNFAATFANAGINPLTNDVFKPSTVRHCLLIPAGRRTSRDHRDYAAAICGEPGRPGRTAGGPCDGV